MGEKTLYDYLNSELIVLNMQRDDLAIKIKEYCQNKNYPLDKRWELFIDSSFGFYERWHVDFDTVEIEQMRDFNRYEEVYANDLIDLYFDYIDAKLHKELKEESDNMSDKFFIKNYVNPKVDIFKEEILEKFIRSFTYDW